MSPVYIHPRIEEKSAEPSHGSVTPAEVRERFENHTGGYCVDNRAGSQAHDPSLTTLWFVGITNKCKKLKVIFVNDAGTIYLKSAHSATPEIERIFKKYSA